MISIYKFPAWIIFFKKFIYQVKYLVITQFLIQNTYTKFS